MSAPVAAAVALLLVFDWVLFAAWWSATNRNDRADAAIVVLCAELGIVIEYEPSHRWTRRKMAAVKAWAAGLFHRTFDRSPAFEPVCGWPAEEPNPVEGPITEPIPVQPATAPMALGDEIEADFRAAQVHAEQPTRRMVERDVDGFKFRVMEP